MNALSEYIVTGRIVTMDAERRVLDDGGMHVLGDRIVDVGTRAAMLAANPDVRTLSVADAIVIPGLIDAHTHTTQALVRGLIAHELPMIYRLYIPATSGMRPEEAAVASRLCMAQLLRSGVTTLCEGAIGVPEEEVEAIIGVASEVGIRCNIHRGLGDQSFHHAALYSQITDQSWLKVAEGAAEKDLEITASLLGKYPARSSELITGSVCASGITNFSESYIRQASVLALQSGAKLHIHAARDREEVEFSLAVFGRRPIEYLEHIGALGGHTVLAHAMLASESEIVSMGRAGCSVAHSSAECINILNAVPNVKMMRSVGVSVGLGCDNALNDLFEVMRAAWLIHGATRGIQNYDPEILTADDILAMATIEAAKVLGLDHVTGSLEAGKQADFVVLDGGAPHLFPTQSLVAEIVRYASRAEVRHVFVAGRQVVSEGKLLSVDIEKLRAQAARFSKRVHAVAAPRKYRSRCLC